MNDWRQAVRTPTTYRVGSSTCRLQVNLMFFIVLITIIGLSLYVVLSSGNGINASPHAPMEFSGKRGSLLWAANSISNKLRKYPLTDPVITEKGLKYRIGIISDLDQDSKSTAGKWISYLRRGNFYIQFNKENPKASQVNMEWDSGEPVTVKSDLNQGGRGMELSELTVFNGKLYTCDDRTGIVFELVTSDSGDEVSPVPWVILADGNGTVAKGFKCEWIAVKDGYMWIGGLGKEWTTASGELVNFNPQYVKRISATGEVKHYKWRSNYAQLARALDIKFPGYVIHESASWSETLQKWVFLPRRASSSQYNEKTDEKMGTNIMLLADANFENVEVRHVGSVVPTHGFSSFKFIPGTNDQLILALKSEEFEGKTATYMLVFDLSGNILLPETKVGDHKYEGVEFL